MKETEGAKAVYIGRTQFTTAVILWIVLIAASLGWNWFQVNQATTDLAVNQARIIFTKDLLYRRWVAHHGGVYVKVSDYTPPNPYLSHVEDRDLVTVDGKRLTLVNPAYMLRQVNEMETEKYGIKGHLTALDPIRPENSPDEWEAESLRRFMKGVPETHTVATLDGHEYLRFMKPLMAEHHCFKCHRDSNLEVGDIMGGISIALPIEPYIRAAIIQKTKITLAHLMIGLLGLAGFGFGYQQHQRSMQALRRSEERLRTLVDSTPDVICFKDGQGRWLEANEATLHLFRLNGVDYRGKSDRELSQFTSEECGAALAHCEVSDELAWQQGCTSRTLETVTTPEGSQRIYDVIKVPLFKDDGSRKGLLVIGRDVTEAKAAEAELRLFKSAIEQSADSVVITDREANIVYVNPAFERISGYGRQDVLGKHASILESGWHDQAFYDELWRTIESGKSWSGRVVNKKKDGTLYTEEMTVWPVRDDEGRVVNYIAIKRDITELLELEQEKAAMEKRYQLAQRLESIGQLAGGVAHDLNNLLTPILGYCELLERDIPPNEPARGHVEQIAMAGRRARDIVGQLLAFGRKQTIEMKPVDLNEVLLCLGKLLGRTIREDIVQEFRLSPDLPPIMADIGQIEQVILNLAVNAQDAMPDGGRLVMETALAELDDQYAASHQGVKPGTYVMLAISDTGVGMSPEVQERIFEPFYTTKGQDRGTGLGLATVYGIVKQHRGNIWVYSELGQGTTFKIYLPVAGSAPADINPPRIDSQDGKKKSSGPATIVLAEDDPSVRKLAVEMLSRMGHRVVTAANGTEALEVLAALNEPVDLLLTDVIMPDMTGKELYRRASLLLPGLKVLYMSGYTRNVIAHHGVLDEGTAFIHKPFTARDLEAKIADVLKDDRPSE